MCLSETRPYDGHVDIDLLQEQVAAGGGETQPEEEQAEAPARPASVAIKSLGDDPYGF